MPAAGWGKRAAGHSDKKLEEDALLKEIGGQLEDANFDYSQWQRTKSKSVAKRPDSEPLERPGTVHTMISNISADMQRLTAVECSCKRKKDGGAISKKEQLLLEVQRKRVAEQLKILKLRIQARRRTLEEYKMRKVRLLQENAKLRTEIEANESETHAEVKKLLRKYEQYRGGMATLNDRFTKELSEVQEDMEKTRLKIEVDLAGIEKEVAAMENKLKAQQLELHILMNYKDKEYPVKSLRISELQKEIENLKIAHQDDETELQHIVETEIEKFRAEQARIKLSITEHVTEKALSAMHPSLKEMALQNMVMRKEKEFHLREVDELTEKNSQLQEEIQCMLRDPKTNIRQQMFPEFFPDRPKCTPDMDVVLDIPTQEWLPI